MKKIYLSIVFSLFLSTINFAQNAIDCAVRLGAAIQVSPPTMTISWVGNATTTQYTVYRKLKSATAWGFSVATLTGTVNQYVDNTVSTGVSYEYKVERTGTGYTGAGYINAGIEIPAIENRGNLILVVDSTFIVTLAPELKRLQTDLEGDGWNVKRIDVLRTGSVTNVKAKIVTTYSQDPTVNTALFIIGHVPVPYSGNIYPDGHTNHEGAWPTDSYYSDVNGNWTDAVVNSTTLSPARTKNIPGDGKFDQSYLPSLVEMQTGRVDFFNMPTFTLTETQLLQNYLNKDHEYRKKIFTAIKRAVVYDNFGYMGGESFAGSGYNNFSTLVGSNSVTAGPYLSTMTGTNNSYLWSYGCGGGSFTSASGIGNTANFAASNLQGVFTMLFGSYFGDWDTQDNFLRAPLAQGRILTNTWSGRPHVQFHHMALGEHIGYGMKVTQNYQGSLYYPNIYGISGNWVHTGLMGDPTLRNDVVAPVSSVVATRNGNNCNITWAATTETNILGYNIYMKNDTNKTFVKINSSPIAGTSYTDNCMLYPGIYTYMVRALKLENTPSGSYYNLSEGIADTSLNNQYLVAKAYFTSATISNSVTFTNASSTNVAVYSWTFGNGASSTATNPVVTYTTNGTFIVSLIASNVCDADTFTNVVNITDVGLDEFSLSTNAFKFFPNPANTNVTISNDGCESCTIIIYNSEGKQMFRQTNVNDKLKINVSDYRSGLYLIKLVDKDNKSVSKKLIID